MECALGHGYPACASRKLIGIWANIGIFMLFARAFAVAISWRGVLQLTSLIAFGAMSHAVHAAVIDVQVLDRNGKPVSGVAVYVLPSGEPGDSASPGTSAVMDQVDVRFVPHLLVIQTGTSVSFPNTDTIAHHVYSFSNPNQFMLPIYKGNLHPPVTFEHSGVVTLGCNIHDNMLGYVLIVDTDAFRKTNSAGKATLPMEKDGEYEVVIWSPRLRDAGDSLSQSVIISDTESQIVRFDLAKRLRPVHDDESQTLPGYGR